MARQRESLHAPEDAVEYVLLRARRSDNPLGALLNTLDELAPEVALDAGLTALLDLLPGVVPWSNALEVLLRLARRLGPSLESEHAPTAHELERELWTLTHDFTTILSTPGPTGALTRERSEQLLAAFKEFVTSSVEVGWDEEASVLVAARALALAIDEVCADAIEGEFIDAVELTLVLGRGYPVHRFNPVAEPRLIAGSANTRPDHQPLVDLGAVPHFRIADDDDSRCSVVINWNRWCLLSPLSGVRDFVLATCHPSQSLEEFEFERDEKPSSANRSRRFSLRRRDREPGHYFRNHGPRPEIGQLARLRSQLLRAADKGAHAAIVPEYCLREGDRATLCEYLETLPENLRLVVLGTSEVDASYGRTNEALVWFRGDDPSGDDNVSRKMFPAEIRDPEDGNTRAEDIALADRPELRVWRSDRWSIAVVICRDAQSPELIDQLARLGVNLCLVPAFSDRTASILGSIMRLRTDTQAFVAAAFAPTVWTPPSADGRRDARRIQAAFDGPYEETANALEVPEAAQLRNDDQGALGVWVFRSLSRSAQWFETKPAES